MSKEPRRVRARRREKDQIGFRPRHVRDENTSRKCGICPLQLDKSCAQRTASLSEKRHWRFFDSARPRLHSGAAGARSYARRGLPLAGRKGVHGCLRGGVPGSTIRRTALGRRRNPGGGPHQFNQKMLDGLQNRPTSPKSVQTNAGPGCREAAGAVSCEGDCKPGSVSDSHLSRRAVANAFKPPPKDGRAGHMSFPRCCSG